MTHTYISQTLRECQDDAHMVWGEKVERPCESMMSRTPCMGDMCTGEYRKGSMQVVESQDWWTKASPLPSPNPPQTGSPGNTSPNQPWQRPPAASAQGNASPPKAARSTKPATKLDPDHPHPRMFMSPRLREQVNKQKERWFALMQVIMSHDDFYCHLLPAKMQRRLLSPCTLIC